MIDNRYEDNKNCMGRNATVDIPLHRYGELLQKEAYMDLLMTAGKTMPDYQLKELLGTIKAILWGAVEC